MSQAIVTANHQSYLCPTLKAGTDLMALLARCSSVSVRYPDGYHQPAVYEQGPLKLEMEVVNLKAVRPEPKAAKVRRALPPVRALELEWRNEE